MTYNFYIKTQTQTFNILNINREELDIVIDAYNKGKEEFFLNGKKYWLSKLFEIKVFTFTHPEKFKDFIELAYSQDLFQQSYFGDPYLLPIVLREGGEEVTKEFIKGDFGYLSKSNGRNVANSDMEIFISHSSSDTQVAKLIIEIVRKAFSISSDKIRCTSVPGYKLKAGANTDEQLKKDIFSSKAFIGLITKESISSTYVLFELGARWGADLPLIPLICDIAGTSLLNGPIKNINALNAIDSSDMLQFLNDLGDILDLKPENPSSYIEDIEKLKQYIQEVKPIEKNEPFVKKNSDEFYDAEEIIKKQSEIEWPDDYKMRVNYIEEQRNAVEKLRTNIPEDLTESEFKKIRERAKKEWPLNFEMRLYEEKNQIESLRKLKKI